MCRSHFIVDFWFHTTVVREDYGHDFSLLKFAKIYSVTYHMVYPGECSMCTWEEYVFCYWVQCSIRLVCSIVWCSSKFALLIFCLVKLSIAEWNTEVSSNYSIFSFKIFFCSNDIFWYSSFRSLYIFTIDISSCTDPFISISCPSLYLIMVLTWSLFDLIKVRLHLPSCLCLLGISSSIFSFCVYVCP